MFDNSLRLAKDHGGLLAAGFFLFFFSVFGQSAFFGVYLPFIQEELDLTKTGIGSIYAMATIASAIVIAFSGKALDYMPLRIFLAIVLVGVAVGCFTLAFAVNVVILFIAFFLLRQFGQGLMVLSATTSVNRYLDKNRGKAQALISLGGPAHLMTFPLLALALEDYIEWRHAWIMYGLFVLFILLPVMWFYMRNHQRNTHDLWEKRIKAEEESAVDAVTDHWTRKNVLMNWKFYALSLITMVSPFIGTVVVFYQRDIADAIGISPIAFAATFPLFSFSTIIASLVAGHIIDKYGEVAILTAFPIIYTAGLLVLSSGISLPVVYAGMALIGAGNGMISTAGGPLLAFLYGTKHLGAIKSLLFSMAILSSALSPFMFGYFMDHGVGILTIFSWAAYFTAPLFILGPFICRKKVV